MNRAPPAASTDIEGHAATPAAGLAQVHAVLDAIAEGCLLVAADGGIRHANRAAAEMFGYAPQELLALAVSALVPLRVRDRHPARMAEFGAQPCARPMSRRDDVFAVRSDGSEFPVEVGLNPLRLNDEPLVLALVTDLTRRRQAEEALRECHRLSDDVIAAAQEGIVVYGPDRRYKVWNPFMEKLTGISARDVIGRHPLEVFPFLDDAGVMSRLDAAFAGEVSDVVEFPFAVKQSGRSGWIANRTAPMRNARGEIVGAIATVVDIGKTRREAEEMRLAREFFETTFAAAPVGMALVDIEGRYIRVNEAMIRFVGYSEAELLARTYMEITHADDLEANLAARQGLLAGAVKTFRMEKRFIHKDGRAIWALLVVSLVSDKGGRPLYSVGQMVDIDKQKRAESLLIESREQLRQLSFHQESLLEAERKRIASEIHDELGQLLTSLKMDVSLLRLNFGHDAALLKKVGEMRTLVEKTIDVVRQVASRLRPAALDLGLVPAIEWLSEDYTVRYETPCRVAVSGTELVLDDVVATTVFRVVQESLTNVARHASATLVVVDLHIGERSLALSVRDDGCGFDPARVSKTSSFGLFSMRERIRALGGSLSISSRPRQGTTVAIELPMIRGGDRAWSVSSLPMTTPWCAAA